jgi:hypothetical protein
MKDLTKETRARSIVIIKYLIRRAKRNGYADQEFYRSLKNFQERFHAY